jgi:hypothetical protein
MIVSQPGTNGVGMGYYSLLLVVEVLCMLDMHKGYL